MAQLPELHDVNLSRQIKALGNEVERLRKIAAARGNELYSDGSEAASDYYSDFVDSVRSSLPALRKRAMSIEKAVSGRPAAVAAVGLVVVGLVASLVFSSRPAAPPPKGRKRSR